MSHLPFRVSGYVKSSCICATAIIFGLSHVSASYNTRPEVISLSDVLEKVDHTSAVFDDAVYKTPTDETEGRYIQYRIDGGQLDDTDVLLQYRRRIRDLTKAPKHYGGILPLALAQGLADPAHALWREIVQRGLTLPADLPSFHQAWAEATKG